MYSSLIVLERIGNRATETGRSTFGQGTTGTSEAGASEAMKYERLHEEYEEIQQANSLMEQTCRPTGQNSRQRTFPQ